MLAFIRAFEIELVIPSQLAQSGFRRIVRSDDPSLQILEVVAEIGRSRERSSHVQFPSRSIVIMFSMRRLLFCAECKYFIDLARRELRDP